MNSYEAVVILTNKISEEETQDAVSKIKDLISSNGEVVAVDEWGKRKLAYEIKHEQEGQYFLFTFNAEAKFISEFERVLRINTQVLKQMVIKK